MLLFDGPSDSSPAKMTAYYGSNSNRRHFNLGWILSALGLFALIWFVSALRERVRESERAAGEQERFSRRSSSSAEPSTSPSPWPGSRSPTGSSR